MPMIDFSTKLQNTEIFSVALLKVDSITNALLVILKFVGTLETLDSVFSIVTAGFTPDFHVIFHEI